MQYEADKLQRATERPSTAQLNPSWTREKRRDEDEPKRVLCTIIIYHLRHGKEKFMTTGGRWKVDKLR